MPQQKISEKDVMTDTAATQTQTRPRKSPTLRPRLCISFDPGVNNLGVAILDLSSTPPKLVAHQTWNVTGEDHRCDAGKLYENLFDVMADEPGRPRIEWMVTEDQPVIPGCGSVRVTRNNSFVQGGLEVAAVAFIDRKKIIKVSPSAVKRHLKANTGQYASNKRVAIEKAYELLQDPSVKGLNDHEADAILDVFYCLETKRIVLGQ